MQLLVSGATVDVETAPPHVGVLLVPAARTERTFGRSWAVDNGAFSGFDAGAFVELLGKVRGRPGCQFVAAPDVVADARETLRLYALWAPMIRALGFPVALVAQDGLTVRQTPWTAIDALFIGGSTDWKLSRHADDLLSYAAVHGKWRHVGRVNSRRRMRHFLGRTDSIDGSGFSRWPKRIGLASRWLEEFAERPRLPGVA
jgi:hypothetical protein